ncbi:MAG: P1 family peptidase [Eubacterium sp.]
MKEIAFNRIENIKMGHAQDFESGTGCTVIICEKGAPTGVDVRGGGPASRETELLNPVAASGEIHAVLLSGGSAFGLDAAGGVMRYLSEHNIGFDTGVAKVPLVCQSCIFDLGVGKADAYPDAKMGYEACVDAEKDTIQQGNIGAGTGATVGKLKGPLTMMKSGIGTYAVQIDTLKVGAIVVVNALGDIFNSESGQKLAGMLTPDGEAFEDSESALYVKTVAKNNLFTANTTLGVIVTNGCFNKVQAKKIAAMAQNGYARSIRPVHTTADGDSVYAMSVGDVDADIDVVGTLSARVMSEAIKRAVLSADHAYGLKVARDFLK